MSDSGRKIDYSARPAKGVERKIICELLSNLDTGIPINLYRYIGFGSYYFSDFILFHNHLGIDKMVSIENSQNTERYDYNKPYKCIEMKFCDAIDALTREIDFPGAAANIIWLDYDDVFCMDMVTDIITASQKINAGSLLFATFNITLPATDENNERLPFLKSEYNQYLPQLKEKDIDNNSYPSIVYSIIYNAIQKALSSRNIVEPIDAKSIFFVKYRDGATMITIGYYFYESGKEVDLSSVAKLPGITTNTTPINLKIPGFTKAEIREINKMLPGSSAEEICSKFPFFEIADIQKYINLYKYYPNYIDSPYYT